METGAVVLAVAVALAVLLGLARRRADGRFRLRRVASAKPSATASAKPTAEVLSPHDIGAGFGERATLVQFSSAFCAPCRATRQVLGDVAGVVEGVAYVEIDAEAHLGLVRRLGVMRTPTVLVLDAGGRITTRSSGQPRKADVIAALGTAVPR